MAYALIAAGFYDLTGARVKMTKSIWALAVLCGIVASGASAQTGTESVALFQAGSAARSTGMEINQGAVEQFRNASESVKLGGVPLINGSTAEFTLSEMTVFSPDAVITAINDNGVTESLPLPDIRTWYGTDAKNPQRVLFASADADGRVKVMVTGDEHTSVTVISPNPGDNTYRIEPANLPAENFCLSEGIMVGPPTSPAPEAFDSITRDTRSDVIYEIEMMVDVGYNLRQKLQGNNTRILDYIVDLFGAVNVIYQRDLKARLGIEHLNIWHTADSFSVNHPSDTSSLVNAGDQLYNYRDFVNNNRVGMNYDLAHLLSYNPTFGGVAFLGVLGNEYPTYRVGVSNVYADGDFPSDINSYHWDTMVTAHEIGHNIGSPHTHCYNPPIDCCYIESACTGCASSAPAAGTIMSYCHLQFGSGGSIIMNFHQRCIDLMRPFIESSARVSPFADQPNIIVEGGTAHVLVPNGSVQATILNGTLLEAQSVGGAAVTRTFTIRNDGNTNLNLSGSPRVAISGSTLLSVSSQPAVSALAPGAAATFDIQFNPQVAGTHSATVSISTNDPDLPTYTFGISGRIAQTVPPQTFTWNGSVPIPDNDFFGGTVSIPVSGFSGFVTDLNLKFNGTNCSNPAETGLQHPRMSDLAILLESPSGTQCWIMQNPAQGTGANFCNTMFDDGVSNPEIQTITSADAPYASSYRPYEALNRFIGQDPNGTWNLTAFDIINGNIGTLRSVSLIITSDSAADVGDWSMYR